jgi:hypothetical protein
VPPALINAAAVVAPGIGPIVPPVTFQPTVPILPGNQPISAPPKSLPSALPVVQPPPPVVHPPPPVQHCGDVKKPPYGGGYGGRFDGHDGFRGHGGSPGALAANRPR